MNASAERQWFGDTLPIDWWDQPGLQAGDQNAFPRLVDAAEERLRQLAGERRGPVHLVAHSFGAQIALRLAGRAPELLSGLILLGASRRADLIFANLADALAAQGKLAKDQTSALTAAARQAPTPETFWPVVQHLMRVPGIMQFYWGPQSKDALSRFQEITGQDAPALDQIAFIAAMNSYLIQPAVQEPVRYKGPVALISGRQDLLLQTPAQELAAWKQTFPQVQQSLVDTGHFVQFEASLSSLISDLLPKE